MIYRVKLKPISPFLTPWQADTIFGHLCWALLRLEGEDALKKFLQPFSQNQPPIIISDGFPQDLLPLPLTANLLLPEPQKAEKRKILKKIKYIPINLFDQIRNAQTWCPSEDFQTPASFTQIATPHASISRLTNTTAQGGKFFEQQEFIIQAPENNRFISIYLKIQPGWEDKIKSLFQYIAHTGYGSKKSAGKGQVEFISMEKFEFSPINNPNGFISLSNFVPAPNDPTKGCYKILVKYGKLGEEFAQSGAPFKKPIIMLQAGSCFKTQSPKEFYGSVLFNISAKPQVIHYAYSFALPIIYPETRREEENANA